MLSTDCYSTCTMLVCGKSTVKSVDFVETFIVMDVAQGDMYHGWVLVKAWISGKECTACNELKGQKKMDAYRDGLFTGTRFN